MRKFVVGAALLVLAWIFVVPSCSNEFDCEAAAAVAYAAADDCPDDIEEAASNPEWAAARLAAIAGARRTTGFFYAQGVSGQRIESRKDDASERANEILRDLGRLPPRASASTAEHVEVKVAARMRDEGMEAGVLIINHPEGPCRVVDGEAQPMSCQVLVPALLPKDAKLTVWWAQPGGPMESRTFTGGKA